MREFALLLGCYVLYSLGRTAAGDNIDTARAHARGLLSLERLAHLDVEAGLNSALAAVPALAVAASFWYATLHYLVTPAVLLVLWRRQPQRYGPLRTALLLATAVALICYVLLPMAPPRLSGGYVDILGTTADWGWWSTHASAPAGFAGMTNELAAMPSMHVGWALWCAVAIRACTTNRYVRLAAVAYPVITSLVVIGTGNHWLLDVFAGAAITLASVRVADDLLAGATPEPAPTRRQRCRLSRGGPVASGPRHARQAPVVTPAVRP